MSLYKHYIQTAISIINSFDGSFPFHYVLKDFFKENKKYGSRDRKWISGLCYTFFRTGKAFSLLTAEEKFLYSQYLCGKEHNQLLQVIKPALNESIQLPLREKISLLEDPSLRDSIFPFQHLISEEIEEEQYAISMLVQPDVFLRARPGYKQPIIEKLNALKWNFSVEEPDAIRIASALPADKHFKLNKQVVVQDLNSQGTGNVIYKTFREHGFVPTAMWDCCAASGGKSILMQDYFPGMQIIASDIRASIIHNLKQRFEDAGILTYESFVADLSFKSSPVKNPFKKIGTGKFILADVPCTGSGTWSRTPEQAYYFDEALVNTYSDKQYAISKNAIKCLSAGDWFVYITCSVFAKENEENISRLLEERRLQLIDQRYLKGYTQKADTMFIAIIKAV